MLAKDPTRKRRPKKKGLNFCPWANRGACRGPSIKPTTQSPFHTTVANFYRFLFLHSGGIGSHLGLNIVGSEWYPRWDPVDDAPDAFAVRLTICGDSEVRTESTARHFLNPDPLELPSCWRLRKRGRDVGYCARAK